MYRFDCDYLEGCLPEILERLNATNLEQTVGYGENDFSVFICLANSRLTN